MRVRRPPTESGMPAITSASSVDGGHADLVPVEVQLLEPGEGLVGRFVAGVLQAAGIEQVLQHRPIGRRHRPACSAS